MKLQSLQSLTRLICTLLAAAGCGLVSVRADVIETVGGSTIFGRVVASDGGVIRIETDFAGTIAIRQDQVKTVSTDASIHVALTDGNAVNGKIESGVGGLRVTGSSGSLVMQTGAISALWRDGDKSPVDKAADALRRKWRYELAFDLNGRDGNTDRTFLGISGRAVLQGAPDRLMFYGNYSRSEENDTRTQDEGKGGVDYSNFFTPTVSWYVRTEIGYDHTKDLDLRSQTAAGFGYTFIKKPTQMLEARFGLSYRFEKYQTPTTPNFNSAGIDLGLLHTLATNWARMSNTLSITPSFDDFSNYVLIHDSSLELPVASDKPWKIRIGVKTDYTSDPPPGLVKLDWTYYTQVVLSWK